MNASDVINAIGASPGFVTTIGGSSGVFSYSYTATTTVDLVLTGVLSQASVSVGSGNVAIASTTTSVPFQVTIPFAKGQTAAVSVNATSGNGTCTISARSIR